MMIGARDHWIMARISSPAGDWPAIGRYLLSYILRELRRFALGESESALMSNGQNGPEVVWMLHLSQSRWHRLARLLTRRASCHRIWLARHPGCAELRPYWP